MQVVNNTEKNGIEIYFDEKPDSSILDSLKENGFRWHRAGGYWYAKATDSRAEFVSTLGDGRVQPADKSYKANNDLFELTKTDEIEDNFAKTRLYDKVEISSIIRKHLRHRFPMCKWSCRTDRSSIYLKIVSSPYEKGSEELKAIAHYAYTFAKSYNYDNSEPMTDYFDVNFYGPYEGDIIPYDYVWREATVSELNMAAKFRADLAELQKQEEIREQKEFEERQKQAEIERIEYEKKEKQREEEHSIIESNAEAKAVSYFLKSCLDPRMRKLCTVDEYKKEISAHVPRYYTCQVAREVSLDDDVYKLFCNHLLDDFTFLENMGGTRTLDNRVNGMEDYSRMTKEEKETVEWFSNECVVVSSKSSEKIIIDPQGYAYARYVYFPCDKTVKTDSYGVEQSVSDERDAELEQISDKICEIIKSHNMETECSEIADEIRSARLPFNMDIVRACKDESKKNDMYRIYDHIKSNVYQFQRSGLNRGDEITIFRIDGFIGFMEAHGKYSRFEMKPYAQYADNVEFHFYPERKRNEYYYDVHSEFLVFKGRIELPESLLWDVKVGNTVITKKAKFMSFDTGSLDTVLEYLASIGEYPVINTYNVNWLGA